MRFATDKAKGVFQLDFGSDLSPASFVPRAGAKPQGEIAMAASALREKDFKSCPVKEKLSIDQGKDEERLLTGICRFTNARASGPCYCRLEYAYGGATNFVLSRPGEYHEIHVRESSPFDKFCWFKDYNPNTCYGEGNDVEPGYNYNLVD